MRVTPGALICHPLTYGVTPVGRLVTPVNDQPIDPSGDTGDLADDQPSELNQLDERPLHVSEARYSDKTTRCPRRDQPSRSPVEKNDPALWEIGRGRPIN